jgi:hypothetical protein
VRVTNSAGLLILVIRLPVDILSVPLCNGIGKNGHNLLPLREREVCLVLGVDAHHALRDARIEAAVQVKVPPVLGFVDVGALLTERVLERVVNIRITDRFRVPHDPHSTLPVDGRDEGRQDEQCRVVGVDRQAARVLAVPVLCDRGDEDRFNALDGRNRLGEFVWHA